MLHEKYTRKQLVLLLEGICLAAAAAPSAGGSAAVPAASGRGQRDAGVKGAGEALDAYIGEVESSYRGVRSWKADFVEVYRAGDRERRESGTVVLARGGKMRWDYRHPESKLFLADGKGTVRERLDGPYDTVDARAALTRLLA